MIDTPRDARPLPLDKVSVSGTYYGVKVADIGEYGERVFAFTHDWRRGVAAAHAHIRIEHSYRISTIYPSLPRFVQIFDRCGCPLDISEDDKGIDCDHYGLPPCYLDELGWIAEDCAPGADGAIPVIELEWR